MTLSKRVSVWRVIASLAEAKSKILLSFNFDFFFAFGFGDASLRPYSSLLSFVSWDSALLLFLPTLLRSLSWYKDFGFWDLHQWKREGLRHLNVEGKSPERRIFLEGLLVLDVERDAFGVMVADQRARAAGVVGKNARTNLNPR